MVYTNGAFARFAPHFHARLAQKVKGAHLANDDLMFTVTCPEEATSCGNVLSTENGREKQITAVYGAGQNLFVLFG
jgi:hypothetical protein